MSKLKKVIQVGGTVRSGTTILALVIANADNAISLGEVMHLFFPYKKQHYEKIKQLTADTKWKLILKDDPKNLYENIFKFFPKVELIVDSSKDPLWFKKLSENKKFTIFQLVSYKAPNDLKNSFTKRGMNNWEKVYLNYYKRFFTVFPLAPTVSLEKLLNNPPYLRKLCDFLDILYSENKLDYWAKQHPNFFGSNTVKQKKIDSKILEENREAVNLKGKTYWLFEKLNKKQFTKPTIDVQYKYSTFKLKALFFKDTVLKKLKNEK